MSELRQNMATREWFVVATERAKRPDDFTKTKPQREEMPHSEKCPFCVGNDHLIPAVLYQWDRDGKWVVRSVPNKFSAFSPDGGTGRTMDGIYRKMNGVGLHEVIVESPLHNDNFVTMPTWQILEVINAYQHRFNAALQDERIEAVILFKNYGTSAGCSLAHPHSQMIAMPLVPAWMRMHLEAAKHFFDDSGTCAFCEMLAQERKEEERMVLENDSFGVICPYASGVPFETWIMPRRHQPSFGNISQKEKEDLALLMKDLFGRYYHGLNDPDFNFVIKTPPRDESNDKCYHWFIQVVPRLTKMAGFELGAGMLINVTLPEKNAEFLRNLKVPQEALS
jgi:UDPglucose--hexose-1-phosphate uridylyltransferase